MWQCIAKYKNSNQWHHVTNFLQPFQGEKGILEYMVEKMEALYPNIEYKLVEVK